MAASTRELYLLLRARDEASRVVRGFSSELMRSAAMAQAAALRAEAQTNRDTAARMRAAGATRSQIQAHLDRARALDQEAARIEEAERRHRRFAQSLTAVAGGLETLGIAFALAGGLVLGFFYQSAKLWADYQRQVALTRTQIDGFSASLQEVGDIGIDIARRIPIAFEEIQPALFDIFSSTNANLEQAKILLEAFSKAAVAGQTDIQTAARGTISIMNAYNIPFEQVNKVLDIQFELVRKGVGTYEEFASVFGRIVPAATRAGQSFGTVAAMLAYMTRNGQSAAMASTSAARALEAMTNPKTVARLEDMGIKVRDVQGNFLPLIDVLTQLREKIMSLPPADRVAALFELLKGAGGTIQARRFIEQVLLREGELEDFRDLLLSMGNASGVMEEKFGEMADTAAAKMQLLSNRWTALRLAMGEAVTPILLQVVEMLSKAVEWFNNLDPVTKKVITQFIFWGAVLSLVGGVLLGIIGFITALVAGFMLAGAEILVVIGIVAALGTAFVATAASIYALWQESQSFRDGLMDMKKSALDFWNNGLKPALEALTAFYDSKVKPAIKEMIDFLGRSLGGAVGFLADVIQHTLIPVLQQMVKWYHENQTSVDRAIGVLIVFAKWGAKVGAVLAAIFLVLLGGPVIAIIVAFIAVVWAMVAAFTAVVDAVIASARWLEKTWNTVWAAVSSWFKETWNDIVGFFQMVWANFVGGLSAGLDFLRGIWEAFWSVFGGIIKAGWEVIVAVVDLGIAIISKVIQIGLYILKTVWDAFWLGLTTTLKVIWETITFLFQAGLDGIMYVWNLIWGLIGDNVKATWNSITTFLTAAWNSLTALARAHWNAFYNTIATFLNAVWEKVKSIWSTITNFFSNAGSMLLDAGKNVIQGLIDGIENKLNALRDKLKKAAQIVRDFWPFSPAKTGPLSGSGDLYKAGQEITNRLAEGMLRREDALAMASAQLARRIQLNGEATGIDAGGNRAFAPVGSRDSQGGTSKTINNEYNIYTQEIDPKRNAAELGFLIDGRM